MIQQSLQNKLREMNKDREVVSLISQVIVNDDDPSFKEPTKYVGPRYSKIESEKMAKKFNWIIKEQEKINIVELYHLLCQNTLCMGSR